MLISIICYFGKKKRQQLGIMMPTKNQGNGFGFGIRVTPSHMNIGIPCVHV